jgi:hypothetical protein
VTDVRLILLVFMRAKIVLPILGLTGLLLLLAVKLRFGALTPEAALPTQSMPASSPAPIVVQTPAGQSAAGAPPRDSIQPKIDAAALEDQRTDASRQRVRELAQLGATKDTKSLPSILSDLTNGDAEIRRAALSAALDYGDRSAIPALQEAMDTLADPQEKVSFLQAINYLKLPTLTEMNLSSRVGTAPSLAPGN